VEANERVRKHQRAILKSSTVSCASSALVGAAEVTAGGVGLAIPNSNGALSRPRGSSARAGVDRCWCAGNRIASVAMIESAPNATPHTSLLTALHSALDLSERAARQRQDWSGEDPFAD